MKKVAVLIVILLVTGACWAEQAIFPTDDWDKQYADEASVILSYYSTTTLYKDYSYLETVQQVKRIQNEAGMSEGELNFLYNPKYDKVRYIKAFITTPEGKRYRYKMIQDIDVASQGEYSDYRRKVITMPNVVPGSVIDITYEIFHSQGPLKGHFFTSFLTTNVVPMKYSFVKIVVPEGLTLYFKKINNAKDPVITSAKGAITYLWEANGNEAYDKDWSQEQMTPPAVDCMPIVYVSTIRDWAEFANIYSPLFMQAVVSDDKIKNEVKNIIGNKTDVIERITAIRKYVYDNFRYVAMNLNSHNYLPHPATEVFKNRFGDCKDQSIIFIAMLKEAGIPAYPVLIRNETEGDFVKLAPATDLFTHVIVAIPIGDKTIFVDPLIDGFRIGEIPYELEGCYALILDGQGGKALQIPYMSNGQKTETSSVKVKLEADGSAEVTLENKPGLAESVDLRKKLKLATGQEKEAMLDKIESLTQGGTLISNTVEGVENDYGPIAIKLQFKNPSYVIPRGPYMIFGPSGSSMSEDFPAKKRKYPVWLNNEVVEEQVHEFTIPDNYQFEYVPKNVSFNNDWVSCDVSYKRSGPVVQRNLRVLHKRSFVPPGRYQEFKDFMLKLDRSMDEAIVIRRNK